MKIAFFSNFLNHHQLPMCQEFVDHPDVEFKFVACDKISNDRLNMGYADMNVQYPFVVRAYEDEQEAIKIASTYDIVIFGASPIRYISLRMQKNLISFRFSERLFKKGTWRRVIPRTMKKIYEGYTRYRKLNMYLLCASAYTSYDLSLCGFSPDKCYKWGYFPKAVTQDVPGLLRKKSSNKAPEILYAGRLLRLKRVMDTVHAVHRLVEEGENLHFTIIGDGETKAEILSYIKKNALEKYITILPFMKPEEVRAYMERADIYVFSSDFNEGWGAVVNEAMNSACALVVSHAVGSAPYLVKNGENGFVYKCADVGDLAEKLRILINDKSLRERLGTYAYHTVTVEWNAELAVERFVDMCKKLKNTRDVPKILDGPCSPAGIIKNDWIKAIDN